MKLLKSLFFGVVLVLATAGSVGAVSGKVALQEKSTLLKIISKPQANARGCGGSGRAVVKVTFDRSGEVTAASTITPSGCQQFNQDAVRAARKIKFEPATKNGVPITVIRSIEYSYAVY